MSMKAGKCFQGGGGNPRYKRPAAVLVISVKAAGSKPLPLYSYARSMPLCVQAYLAWCGCLASATQSSCCLSPPPPSLQQRLIFWVKHDPNHPDPTSPRWNAYSPRLHSSLTAMLRPGLTEGFFSDGDVCRKGASSGTVAAPRELIGVEALPPVPAPAPQVRSLPPPLLAPTCQP